MEFAIGFGHFRRYPCTGLSVSFNVTAIGYYFFKGRIKGDPEGIAF
jgi:hypothetical protein